MKVTLAVDKVKSRLSFYNLEAIKDEEVREILTCINSLNQMFTPRVTLTMEEYQKIREFLV